MLKEIFTLKFFAEVHIDSFYQPNDAAKNVF